MPPLDAFLADLAFRGVHLEVEGKDLKAGPRALLTDADRAVFREHKEKLIRLLAGAPPVRVPAAAPVPTTALSLTPPKPAPAAPLPAATAPATPIIPIPCTPRVPLPPATLSAKIAAAPVEEFAPGPSAPWPMARYAPDVRHGDYREVLPDFRARLIFTSPPYNIGSAGPRRDGNRPLGKYDPKSFGAIRDYPDDLPEDEYQNTQEAFLLWAADHLLPGGILGYNHKPRRKNNRLISPHEWFMRPAVQKQLTYVQEVIWDRGSTHNSEPSMLRPISERLFVFYRAGGCYRFDNRGLPHPNDVWHINRVHGKRKRKGEGAAHCAPFPLELAEAVLLAWSEPGDLVVDPYLGSGTTAVAARKLGRCFIGSEIIERYHLMTMDRLKAGDV
jgi:DNA modification methylase